MAYTHLQTWGTYYARSGTGTPHSDGKGDIAGEISVYYEQNYASNLSTIRIDHKAELTNSTGSGASASVTSSYRANNGSYGGSYQSKSRSLPIIGKTTTLFYIPASGYSTYHTVYHNADGSCQLYVNGSITGTLYIDPGNYSINRTSSFNKALPVIPRYANITSFNASARSGVDGLTQIYFTVSTDVGIDWVQHSINGGGWTDSGNQIITGLSPGNTYSLKCRVRRTDSGQWTESGTIYVSTLAIATITNSNVNFDVDNGLPGGITYTNPSGADVDLYITDSSDNIIVTRDSYISGSAIIFSSGEKNDLYAKSPDSNTFSIKVKIRTNNNNGYVNTKTGTATISNANPIFTTFTYADVNATTLALTGDSSIIVKDYSTVRATITSGNKAVAVKGANMTRSGVAGYRLNNGSLVAWSNDSTVTLDKANIDDDDIIVSAIDSRSNATNVILTVPGEKYLKYFNPVVLDANITRTNDTETTCTLTFNGTWWGGDFGNVNNDITFQYRYRVSDSEIWSSWSDPIEVAKDGNNFSFEDEIAGDLDALGFTNNESFIVEVKVTDELSSYTKQNIIIVNAQPTMAKHKNGVAIKKIYDEVNNPIFDAGRFRIDEDGNIQQYDETLEEYVPILEYEVVDTW